LGFHKGSSTIGDLKAFFTSFYLQFICHPSFVFNDSGEEKQQHNESIKIINYKATSIYQRGTSQTTNLIGGSLLYVALFRADKSVLQGVIFFLSKNRWESRLSVAWAISPALR